jgi:ornithine carbamoyltransferase
MDKIKEKRYKDFLTLRDFSKEEIINILGLSEKIKNDRNLYSNELKGKNFALLFDKPSTRTRLSFEAGLAQLGANVIYLDPKTLQLGRGETYEDTARVFSSYLDGLVIRTFRQDTIEQIARKGSIPVINALTDLYHPCQILADLFTLFELHLLKNDLKFSYVGDPNNVLNSLVIGFSKLGLNITVGCPDEYQIDDEILAYAKTQADSANTEIKIINDPLKAVEDADVIYTDVWVSMGDEESKAKKKILKKFQVNRKLLNHAKGDAKIMHCLPAHRGEEITSEVLDGHNSIVWQQAENRLYAQKALLVYLFAS